MAEVYVSRKVVSVVQVDVDHYDVTLECGHVQRILDDNEPTYWMLRCKECEEKQCA